MAVTRQPQPSEAPSKMTRTFKTTMLLTLLVALIGATSAFAQSPADEVYNGPQNGVLDVVSSSPTPAPSTVASSPTKPLAATPASTTPTTKTEKASSGDLPFTGFEAGLVAVAGLALLAGGFAMRRVSRDAS